MTASGRGRTSSIFARVGTPRDLLSLLSHEGASACVRDTSPDVAFVPPRIRRSAPGATFSLLLLHYPRASSSVHAHAPALRLCLDSCLALSLVRMRHCRLLRSSPHPPALAPPLHALTSFFFISRAPLSQPQIPPSYGITLPPSPPLLPQQNRRDPNVCVLLWWL